jgi:translation elongation factor EF-Tu-like GTPase
VSDGPAAGDGVTRRRWLARLGAAADLGYPFFAVAEVFGRSPGVTVAVGELATGRVVLGEELEAVGYAPGPAAARVARIERPDALRREVADAAVAVAGQHYGLTLEHDPASPIVRGQGLAPAGRLRAARGIEADVWVVPDDDWPIAEGERRIVLGELAEGRGLRLFFHTRATGARAVGAWRPESGREGRARFELDEPVPLYEGARFGLLYETLTVGAGFVL